MSGVSSSAAGWSGLLRPAAPREGIAPRADDPRLGEAVAVWEGDPAALRAGRPVLLGFPQDEGVRRNQGRVGAAAAPGEIRRWLYRLVPPDPAPDPLDLGDLIVTDDLEASQERLGLVVAELLRARCVPIVLGGGHETAYGTYLGHVGAARPVAVVNVDAHLDVRPLIGGRGHSGSPFRQMLEHPARPLPGSHYVCLGAQPANTSRPHADYVRGRGGEVVWADEVRSRLAERFVQARERFATTNCPLHVSLDADAVRSADVPGVSAPAALGLAGDEVAAWARLAGGDPGVASFELVEINPTYDLDGRSARWAAVVVWEFLAGLGRRP